METIVIIVLLIVFLIYKNPAKANNGGYQPTKMDKKKTLKPPKND